MSFLAYDLTFLGVFVILLVIFLYIKRKNIKREGLLLLYRTNWGIKLIHRIGEKYKKTLKVLSYISIGIGYLLMAGMLYLVGEIVWLYVFNANAVRAIKIPPITPLIPYLPQIFNLNFLPPFYFTYWIVIIAIIAVTHEFAHGIFAARNKIKIKNTGFGFFPFFLPIFLAAFVELDEKKMAEKKTFDQLSVLSAGTFANVLTGIFFFVILIIFFSLAFAPAGVSFDAYPSALVNMSSITAIGNISLNNPSYQQILNSLNNTGLNEITTTNVNYVASKSFIIQQKGSSQLILYEDAPAVRANLESVILDINGQKVTSTQELANLIHGYSPGENVTFTVLNNNSEPYNRTISLGQNPDNQSQSWLGIGFYQPSNQGILANFISTLSSFKRNNIYYASVIGDGGIFIYNLLWWLIIISFSVALVNMLPMGIFDGGRFFYLTVLAITKKENVAKWTFKIATYLFLFLLFVVMFFWVLYVR